MGKRVKSVSMPGLAAKLEELDGAKGSRWSIRRTVTYTRSYVSSNVEIFTARNVMTGAGWDGIVARAALDDDGLLCDYLINTDVPYKVGKVLDAAWEALA